MNSYIIFGCGEFGKAAYLKLHKYYKIEGFVDNNKLLWGKELFGLKVLNLSAAVSLCKEQRVYIIIAIKAYSEIESQLREQQINTYLVWKNGFLYQYGKDKVMYPVNRLENHYYKKENENGRSILFVQKTPCIRTNKIAKKIKDRDIQIALAYLSVGVNGNEQIEGLYDHLYPICSFQEFVDYVNNSEFDLIHSSNEPDLLTTLLTNSNKPIIHDCHDLSSAYKNMSPNEMVVEYVANVKSNGVIYTTEGIREVACKKFSIDKNKTFVLENLISEELQPERKLNKLSILDGEMHCVYEGGILGGDKMSHRYFEEIWKKITDCGIHIHFYSPSDEKYCREMESKSKYLHFEGNYTSKELAVEMSKYDVGLCILNINNTNRQYLEYASPNKVQEYVNAGLPVAVSNIQSLINYVEENSFGKNIDMDGDIKAQLEEIVKIKIPERILQKKGLTLESKIPELISFYQRCLANF